VDSVTPDEPRRAPIRWHVATVRDARAESPTVRTLLLDVPAWPDHRAGHHVDVRLTAEDGYQASRSYSIASAPEHDAVELTIERFEDGEVSRSWGAETRSSCRCGELVFSDEAAE
jgi:ferredoxin-NADP reductase